MFWQVEDVPSVPDFQSIPGVPSVPCVPCFSWSFHSLAVLSIYLRILPTPSRAFLAGTARLGYEKE